ncbi:MAG: trypsin-like peptidase domain-containing protein [Cyanobacteria bacterium]|nr:trypsin-like peptidase domain-containing protein [Cyanobacteriota bacterium]
MIKFFTSLALLLALASQGNVLRVRVMVTDGTGAPIPLPRVVLLVSDNPATGEPRRVRTDANGLIELKLAPGSYTVESDRPVAFGGKTYLWTQIVDVVPGKDTVLDLTAKNAEIGTATNTTATDAAAPVEASSAVLLSKFHDSVVEIWTPTRHAEGFLIDSRGLIATSHSAINGATAVEIEIRTRTAHFKVPGNVIADDRATGAAVIWIDPQAMGSIPPIDLRCGAADRPVARYEDEITTIAAPMLTAKDVLDGVVTRVTSQAIFADLRISRETAGGPVFNSSGDLLGISSIEADPTRFTRIAAWTIPIEKACEAMAIAEKMMAGAAPPKGIRLPIETDVAGTAMSMAAAKQQKAPLTTIKASDFDITLLTSTQAREDGSSDPRLDFDTWTDYLRYTPPVLLVRVSPQLEESFWKTLARGAAMTQGVNLPPLKNFTSNFLRLRAQCGDTEVLPIHPFVIERRINDKQSIREGLYVFEPAAFGPQCSTIRFSMYSEKDSQKPDTRAIDPKLFDQLIKP